jgi:hypothetical protein
MINNYNVFLQNIFEFLKNNVKYFIRLNEELFTKTSYTAVIIYINRLLFSEISEALMHCSTNRFFIGFALKEIHYMITLYKIKIRIKLNLNKNYLHMSWNAFQVLLLLFFSQLL